MSANTAAILTSHGGNECVRIGVCEAPQWRPGDVLLRMTASGLNRVDLYMRNSGAGITHRLPLVLGLDGSGIVEACDANSPLTPGARAVIHPALTCGTCEFCRSGDEVLCISMRYLGEHVDGTMRTRLCVPAQNAFPAPASITDVEAASLGVAWLTAWRMIVTKARLQPGESVLIFGIGGSVSLAALQIATALGARAIVTSRSQEKLTRAQALSPCDTISSIDADIVKRALELTSGRGVDVVIENVGGAVWSAALKSLVRGGRLVTCGATTGDNPGADLRRVFIRQLQIFGSTLGTRAEFAQLLAFVETRGLKPHLDSIIPLTGLHSALDRLESGEQFGKIAIAIE